MDPFEVAGQKSDILELFTEEESCECGVIISAQLSAWVKALIDVDVVVVEEDHHGNKP